VIVEDRSPLISSEANLECLRTFVLRLTNTPGTRQQTSYF